MVKNFRYISLLSLLSLMIFSACDSSSSSEDDDSLLKDDPAPVVETVEKISQTFGQDGNLYKPRGDAHGSGAGNLVVLLSSQFTEQFDNCEALTRSGETKQLFCLNTVPWTHIPYSCFSNGDRQTWRADFKCSEMQEVKVTCRLPNKEVVFAAPAGRAGEICSRLG